MKSVNVLKILNENKKLQEKNRKDTSEENIKREKVHKFIDTYVTPKLAVLGLSNVNDKAKLDNIAIDLILMMSNFSNEEADNEAILKKEEIGFLTSNDIKLKKDIGNRIASYLIKIYTYEEKKDLYIKEYIFPMLEELNENETITFDSQALDNKTKSETNKINKLINKFVSDNSKASVQFDIFKDLYDNDFMEKWNFLFEEGETSKKAFVNILKTFLLDNYGKIDFKNLDSLDFTDYTGAKINICVKEETN